MNLHRVKRPVADRAEARVGTVRSIPQEKIGLVTAAAKIIVNTRGCLLIESSDGGAQRRRWDFQAISQAR